MTQRRAAGGGILLGTGGEPEADPYGRVKAKVTQEIKTLEQLRAAVSELDPEARLLWLTDTLFEHIQMLAGVREVLTPMAQQLDALLRWQQDMERWRAEVGGKLLFVTPPSRQ